MASSETNLLIESLPIELKRLILARCVSVTLPAKTVLFEAEQSPAHVHFITSGIASVVTELSDGGTVEVGLVGREGIAECFHLLGPEAGVTRCFMQIAGNGLRMDYRSFRAEFMTEPSVIALVLRYVQYSSILLSQLAACNRLHEVEERLAAGCSWPRIKFTIPRCG